MEYLSSCFPSCEAKCHIQNKSKQQYRIDSNITASNLIINYDTISYVISILFVCVLEVRDLLITSASL